MGRITTWGGRWWLVGGLLVAVFARPANALYLDEDQNISLRARIYSQGSIRVSDSHGDTVPQTFSGQLVQHRNFFNPELDAKLTSYTTWMKNPGLSWMAPDEFSVRAAGWGFYDGIYDYGSGQFDEARKVINSTFNNNFSGKPTHAWFLEGPTFNPNGTTVDTIFPGHQAQDPHDIYATQRRINELYFNYTKGPFFLRLGRQAISWGESDTIALLDANNPFDLTLAAPGVFEDLDESRIPLWTVRSSFNLFETLGPLSSAFVEAYVVPGDIDNNTGILPLLGTSPYSPPGQDPQTNPMIVSINKLPGVTPFQFVLLDQIPKRNFENSRYGFRVQTVVNRQFTVSAWYYTTFQGVPAPVKGAPAQIPGSRNLFVVATQHKLTAVTGVANTFFFEPLDGIVRMEAEYFDNEPGFIPDKNLNLSNALGGTGVLPRADHLRWELGFDRFFFARALNPTNSFTLVSAIVGDWNISETSKKDFYSPQQRPGASGQVATDFVQQQKVEGFAQVHLQTDYMHGRLSPGVTYIQNLRGTYAVTGDLLYRWTDWLLFDVSAVTIGGMFQQLGYFRDRDQIALRVTYQLN